MNLFEYLNNKTKSTLDLAEGLRHFIWQDSVNKLETEDLQITGLTEGIESSFMLSKFYELRQRLGYKLSQGKNMAVVSFLIDGVPHFEEVEWLAKKEFANELTEIYILSGNLLVVDKQPVKEVIKFWMEDGTALKAQGYIENNKGFVMTSEVINYESPSIPVHVFKNNANDEADTVKIDEIIKEIKYLSADLRKEWNKSKLQFTNNKMFGSTKTATEWDKALQSGLDVHDISNPDGTYQLPIAAITGAVATMNQLLVNINWLEDKALKYSFTQRDTISTGSQKNNLEITGFNQTAFEYLLAKKKQREQDWAWFFWRVNQLMDNSTVPSVINPISELEELKLENVRVDVDLKRANAEALRVAKVETSEGE